MVVVGPHPQQRAALSQSEDDIPLVIRALEHFDAYLVATQRQDARYTKLAERLKRKGPEREEAAAINVDCQGPKSPYCVRSRSTRSPPSLSCAVCRKGYLPKAILLRWFLRRTGLHCPKTKRRRRGRVNRWRLLRTIDHVRFTPWPLVCLSPIEKQV